MNDLVAFSTHPWPCGPHHKDVVLFEESQPRDWGSETDASVLDQSFRTNSSRKLLSVYVDWMATNKACRLDDLPLQLYTYSVHSENTCRNIRKLPEEFPCIVTLGSLG